LHITFKTVLYTYLLAYQNSGPPRQRLVFSISPQTSICHSRLASLQPKTAQL